MNTAPLSGRRGGGPAKRALVSGSALVLLLSGCGGSPTATAPQAATGGGPSAAEKLYTEVNGMNGQQRRDKLVPLAEKEGALDLYTSMTSDVADAVLKAFEDQFNVTVNLYRAGSETVLQRVVQEQKAGYQGNDVVETNATELFDLNTEGVLANYDGERRRMVPEAGRQQGWTATRMNLFAPSWNTGLVTPEQAPKTWEDLADPKWDGKLAMELSDSDWYLTLYKYWEKQGKTGEEIDKLFDGMARGAKIVKGHTVQGQLLSAGQFSVAASNYSYIVQQAKAKGAPVDYLPFVQPVIARPNGIGLMKTAKHPAAAMLFADWMLQEGQALLAKQGLTPAIVEGDDPLKDVEIIPIDVEELTKNGDEWNKRYDQVISNGEQVDGN
ncbi:ABC transporter substrate-binding protein [Nonomuraea jiangxiensis]|uniref:Iron(III) transport system substrate-binding protein n=1 Tax=Nonomuraea jiangxiensis TaxID=633440 RepID=A0A1G9SPX5_9ACTN|nr:extracellular solute-binding protein [Nonomuraea jiangxiensis]SDM36885.1 iron(III) transport system substrate-binding protein [Nonomuraea jiangxiensis]